MFIRRATTVTKQSPSHAGVCVCVCVGGGVGPFKMVKHKRNVNEKLS